MFKIAVCDEDRIVRKRMEQMVMAYMEARKCEAQIYEAVSGSEIQAKVHAVLDLKQMVQNNLEKQCVGREILAFPFREGERCLAPHQIIYVESKLHRLYFHLQDEQICTMYDVLNEWEEKLNTYGFLRIHQSYLVNMRYIQEISGYMAYLKQGTKLAVPRARYRQVREEFMTYQRGV